MRGRSRSRTIPEIVREVEGLIASGFKEVVLTGINIGDFDGNPAEEEKPFRLTDLVRAVDQVEGLERLRVSSIDPDEVDDDLADAILNGRTTCHSMHLVLQSGSNVILKRMNRKYTRQIFLKTVERMQAASPDFTVTTDIIVGFPGETDADFDETLEVMREVKFAKIHMFPYSDRSKTRSTLMPNKVPVEVIKHRKQKVLQLAEQFSYELREKFVSRRMIILTENIDPSNPGQLMGHTENFLAVSIPKAHYGSNELIEVELIENTPTGLIGRVIESAKQNTCCG